MRWWDVERVMPLERELFADTAWTAESFWSELAHPESRWYLVVEAVPADGCAQGPLLLGYAGLMVAGSEADVQTVAVARARGRGATSLLLEVRADNAAAIALYFAHGFEQIGVRRRYYHPGDVDALVMRLRPLSDLDVELRP
jgi:ribosomal-protein-alanine N-acetyltransferase